MVFFVRVLFEWNYTLMANAGHWKSPAFDLSLETSRGKKYSYLQPSIFCCDLKFADAFTGAFFR